MLILILLETGIVASSTFTSGQFWVQVSFLGPPLKNWFVCRGVYKDVFAVLFVIKQAPHCLSLSVQLPLLHKKWPQT